MDLWQLHIFVSVVEHKSFSKASRAIHLSQPTVSSHIKELEEHFKCRLLDRLGKTTEPTKAGSILFRYAKKILSLRNQADAAVQEFLGHMKGDISIGGSTIPSAFILPKLMRPFSEQYPDVSIHLTVGDTMAIVRKIKKGDLEIGVVGAKVKDPHIRQEQLLADEMKLIVPANHRWAGQSAIEASSLFTEKFIARERGSGTWRSILASMEDAGFDSSCLDTRITMGNTLSVIQGIIHHMGISILSTIAVQNDIDSGRLAALSVTGLDLNRYFYLTVSEKRTLSPLCVKFIDFAMTRVNASIEPNV